MLVDEDLEAQDHKANLANVKSHGITQMKQERSRRKQISKSGDLVQDFELYVS